MAHDHPSSEAIYPIRVVAERTGINPITLRAGERRYGLIRPRRTPKGHRLYSALDIETIVTSVRRTNCCVVVDQSWPFGSVASEVISQICEHGFDWLDHQPVRVNTRDVPTPYAKNLEYDYLPNPDRIAEAVESQGTREYFQTSD